MQEPVTDFGRRNTTARDVSLKAREAWSDGGDDARRRYEIDY
jgi:hypothetical protein